MTHDTRGERDSQALGRLLAALGLACVALPGALPLVAGPEGHASDPLLLLAWLALVAASVGAACARLRLGLWPNGLAIGGVWSALIVAIGGTSERVLPTPFWGALAVVGLLVAGYALGRLAAGREQIVIGLGLTAVALSFLPSAPGRLGIPWSPAVAAALLDLSPVTLCAECAGLDWMRTAGVYAPVGVDRFERVPWTPELAGPAMVLVGCALWVVAELVERRRRDPSP